MTELAGRILSLEEAAAWAAELRRQGRRVVFTNGCFDLLHRGHVAYLSEARRLGDALVVGLNGDRSVAALKGPGRPLVPAEDRAAVLAALRAVDAVVIFEDLTAEAVVAALQPDVYVKGGDWAAGDRRPPEAAVVERYGGRVVYLPYLPGRSTSSLVARIREGQVDASP
ncbi:MAG: D-glycero-beta-D-manno-heptose 1-phosphate adenylyltransferase [Caldilineales bacterium]|nr:D-glycero-beta-D-manno-heptose 1-phosphate adenylyltransferase [Caldilineales bacterium]MDW8318440.1 D-glycero-beta-D-manno-heptose 1-phosphate adenylyltransferase [Anaerolineae bacterium]